MNDGYDPRIHHRRSIRLRGYDYSHGGAYFVTIVTQGGACLFGEVLEAQMQMNEAGSMVQEVWWGLSQRFVGVEVGSMVVMPNHLHGVIALYEPVGAPLVGAQSRGNRATVDNRATTRVAPTLGSVVGAFKSLTTVEYVRVFGLGDGHPFVGGYGNATITNTSCEATSPLRELNSIFSTTRRIGTSIRKTP